MPVKRIEGKSCGRDDRKDAISFIHEAGLRIKEHDYEAARRKLNTAKACIEHALTHIE